MLDKILRVGILLDFYGALLTEKQKYCVELHYLSDFSLAEIADEMGVSRQAVHDILKRAEQVLSEYEEKLRLVQRYQEEQLSIKKIHDRLASLPEEVRNLPEIRLAISQLEDLLDCSKEV